MPREVYRQRQIIKYLQSKGAWVLNVHGHAYQRKTVDLVACIQGQFYGFEVKQPGQTLTKLQSHEMELIAKAGGAVFRVECVADVEVAIRASNNLLAPDGAETIGCRVRQSCNEVVYHPNAKSAQEVGLVGQGSPGGSRNPPKKGRHSRKDSTQLHGELAGG